MRQIYVQKTVRNALNLHAETLRNASILYAKNTAHCANFLQIFLQFCGVYWQ